MRWVAAVLLIGMGVPHLFAGVLSRDPEVEAIIPRSAYEGVGAWPVEQYVVATGHSIAITSLGEGKEKRTEKMLAEEDCRRQIAVHAAAVKVKDFDEDCYDLKAEISGFRTAATFKLEGREGLFLIGVVKADQIQVEPVFSPKKARLKAFALFEVGHYKEAAAILASLSQLGIQDEETIAFARAASWHVNLDSGVKGEARAAALKGLSRFYYDRQQYDDSVHKAYQLYLETAEPARDMLELLVDLCMRTRREGSAKKFQQELDRRWPTTAPAAVKDAVIEEPFATILAQHPLLLQSAGARVFRHEGSLYLIVVGMTEAKGESSAERLRQIKVARVQAQKEAVAFAEQTSVVATDERKVQTTITQESNSKSLSQVETLNETTVAKVHGVLKGLPEVGTWYSPDGTLFFCAVGRKLD
ncbi:MAG TPA: hypothetical protein VIL86_19570 [Tepidisphaeraceae bacterium]